MLHSVANVSRGHFALALTAAVIFATACRSRPAKTRRNLLVAQAQFIEEAGQQRPGPATFLLMADGAVVDSVADDTSNVFHKVVGWREGLLSAGGSGAALRHWTKSDGKWAAQTLWQPKFGGRFDRLRDFEIANVDDDPAEEIVIATHDQGVIAVADEQGGTWKFTELLREPDVFVHEIEIGDVDRDGRREIYATRSGRNRADGSSQPGSVVKLWWDGKTYQSSTLLEFSGTHAKEILVVDLDRDGADELFVVKEAEIKADATSSEMLAPVQILGPKGEVLTTLEDRQCRFLTACDADQDGDLELLATGMTSGVWMISRDKNGFTQTLIDADSGGFEHALHCADLDNDGRSEIYVAADKQGEIRRYLWNGSTFVRSTVYQQPPNRITWSLSDVDRGRY